MSGMPRRPDNLTLPPLFTRAFILAALANALLNFAAFLFVHLPGFLQQLGAGEAQIGRIMAAQAVGAIATYRNAVEWVKFCGRVVYIGYGKEPVSYETKLFVMKELDILGSRNCLNEFSDVIAFFERRTFDPNILISKSIPIEGVPEALADWAAYPGQTSKIMVGMS